MATALSFNLFDGVDWVEQVRKYRQGEDLRKKFGDPEPYDSDVAYLARSEDASPRAKKKREFSTRHTIHTMGSNKGAFLKTSENVITHSRIGLEAKNDLMTT